MHFLFPNRRIREFVPARGHSAPAVHTGSDLYIIGESCSPLEAGVSLIFRGGVDIVASLLGRSQTIVLCFMMIQNRFFIFGLIWAVACSFSLGGCKERKEERVYRALRGIARSKNPETGLVSMDFTRENGHVVELEGQVTQDTEIFVDGRVATLDDVRIGEEVEVIGYITGSGKQRQMVVTQVVVTRNESEHPPVEPTTQEAGKVSPTSTPDAPKPAPQKQAKTP